jgi:hypothetical protein
MNSALAMFTLVHVLISLVAIASGFIVVFGLLTGKRLNGWTAFFLAMTLTTSVTGFFFPFHGITPAIVTGVISVAVLGFAIYARYVRGLANAWRKIYVINATVALYLNVFVLIVQSFQKIPALKALAPTQKEPPFLIAQMIALIAFLVVGFFAGTNFRNELPTSRTQPA